MSTEFNYDSVPAGLRDIPRWLAWRYNTRKGKVTKVPYGRDGIPVSPTDPANWMTFAEALAQADKDGVGFAFNGDGLGVVDLDACRDRTTGKVAAWAWRILEAFKAAGAYIELSPSGKGFHIISAGAPPRLSRCELKRKPTPGIDVGEKEPMVEAFVDRRYITITGRAASGDLVDCSAEWDRVVAYMGASTAPPTVMPEPVDVPLEVVRDALSVLSTDELGRNMFIGFGMGLAWQYGEEARSTWLEWMARSPNDDPEDSERMWETFGSQSRMQINTILWHARKKGWRGYLDFEFEPLTIYDFDAPEEEYDFDAPEEELNFND